MLEPITGFVICAALIFFCGRNLSKYGDIIAEHLGLGKAWVGIILLASVTSLPELAVGISSVTVSHSADLATGDVLGSCAFNLFILSLLDFLVKKDRLFSQASQTHIMAGAMGIVLAALAGLGLYLDEDYLVVPWISLVSIAFIIIYFFAIRVIFFYEQKTIIGKPEQGQNRPNVTMAKALVYYSLNAALVVAAALLLPGYAQNIAVQTGLGESFVGTLFLAAATSFPELSVSINAAKMGMIDMAIGNLLGSNMFNFLILAIDDAFYTKGLLLKDASDSHLISVFSVIIMTSVAISGITYHNTNKKSSLMATDTLIILMIYVINLLLLYQISR